MSEEFDPQNNQKEGNEWEDVGRQFQLLGESLATAFRTAWDSEENQQRMNEFRSGVESMVQEVDRAIKEKADSPQGQRVRAEAERAVESVQKAGEKTAQEAKPHLVTALHSLNDALQKWIERMEEGSQTRRESEPSSDEPVDL